MILFLASVASSDRFLSIDIGTEYLKIAESSVKGVPTILLNDQTRQVGTPSAIAFKSKRNFTRRIRPDDLGRFQIRFGTQALSQLRHNESSGIRFVPRVFGRSPSEFQTATLGHPNFFIAGVLHDYTSRHPGAGYTFVIPEHWTNEQRRVLYDVCQLAGIAITTIVEDVTALCLLYGLEKSAKYERRPRHALFVDVGATSVKAYSAVFTLQRGYTDVIQTGLSWSERIGGHLFVSAISAARGVGRRKAERLLLSEAASLDFGAVLSAELRELRRVIDDAIDHATRIFALDEIQIVGGASKFGFVREVIRAAARDIPVQREFNAQEALALGGVLAALTLSETNSFLPTYVRKVAAWNMTLHCGAEVLYCQRNLMCPTTLIVNSTGCDVIKIVGPPEHIADGLPEVLGEFRLKNLSAIDFAAGEEPHGEITLASPDPMLKAVKWCVGDKCWPVGFEVDRDEKYWEHYHVMEAWTNRYMDIVGEEAQKMKHIDKIGVLLKKLKYLLIPEYAAGKGVFPLAQEAKEQFVHLLNDYDQGKILSYPPPAVKDALDYLEFTKQQIVNII
jgi:hypothetical protein